jgi:hypothetical protein
MSIAKIDYCFPALFIRTHFPHLSNFIHSQPVYTPQSFLVSNPHSLNLSLSWNSEIQTSLQQSSLCFP